MKISDNKSSRMFKAGIWMAISAFMMLLACESDPTAPEPPDPQIPLSGVLIANEGGFLQGNASLSFLDAETGAISNGVFTAINGEALGDVANSIMVEDTLAYVVVNNSHKIEVISTNSFQRVRTINLPAGSSPRHIVSRGDGSGYVTRLFSDQMYQINLESGALVDSVNVGVNAEEMIVDNDRLFVTVAGGFGSENNTVAIVSTASNAVTDEVQVGDSPQWIRRDDNGLLHVLCAGAFGDFYDPLDDTPGGVWVIDPATDTVIDSIVLAVGDHPSELTVTDEGGAYFINGGKITEYNTESVEISNETFISGFFYHVAYNNFDDKIYVLDAGDFTSPGQLIIYDEDGVEEARHTVGVIPGFISFLTKTE